MAIIDNPSITIISGGGGSLPTPLDPTDANFWSDFDDIVAEGDIEKMELVLPVGTMIPTGKASYPYVQVAHYGSAELSDDSVKDGVYLISCYKMTGTSKTNAEISSLITYANNNTQFPSAITSRAVEIKRTVYYNQTSTVYSSNDLTYFIPTPAEVAGIAGRNTYEEPWDLYLQLVPGGTVTTGVAPRRMLIGDAGTNICLCEPLNNLGTGREIISSAGVASNAGKISTLSSSSNTDMYQEACFIPIRNAS